MIKFHEFSQIELRLLEHLCLVDEDVLERENFGALFSDRLRDGVGQDLFEKVFEGVLLAFFQHDFHHLLTDGLNLRSLGVAGSFNLTNLTSGEGNSEKSAKITISGLSLDEAFDKGVPLLNEGAHLVSGDGETIEVGKAIVSLDFLNLELDDSPGEILFVILGQVTVADAKDAASE